MSTARGDAREVAAERRGFRRAMKAIRDHHAGQADPASGANHLDNLATWEVRDGYVEAVRAACRKRLGVAP